MCALFRYRWALSLTVPQSLSAAPFTPSAALRDDSIRTRTVSYTPSSAWSPVQGGPSASALPIIDPHIKTVWGPSEKMDPAAHTRPQENSLKGIVDDLPTALNELKSLDEGPSSTAGEARTEGTTGPNALQYDIGVGKGAVKHERTDSRSRVSAMDALAAVGGLPFGRQYSEDGVSSTSSYPAVPYTSAPSMVSPPIVTSPPYGYGIGQYYMPGPVSPVPTYGVMRTWRAWL
jgi:hypothetical protein